jgi:broad specificity phosphatase PhoE
VPLSAIYHGPLERAVQTAAIIAGYRPATRLEKSELAGEFLPSDPELAGLPKEFASYLDGFDAAERAEGPALAAAAIERFAKPTDTDTPELHGR